MGSFPPNPAPLVAINRGPNQHRRYFPCSWMEMPCLPTIIHPMMLEVVIRSHLMGPIWIPNPLWSGPVPPRPDPTNPELPSPAPSISHVEFGYKECPWAVFEVAVWAFPLVQCAVFVSLGHAAGLFLMRWLGACLDRLDCGPCLHILCGFWGCSLKAETTGCWPLSADWVERLSLSLSTVGLAAPLLDKVGYPVPNDAPGPCVLNVECSDQLAMLPTGAVGISRSIAPLVVEDAPPLPILLRVIVVVVVAGLFLRLLCGLFHLSGVLSLFLLGHAAGLFLMRVLLRDDDAAAILVLDAAYAVGSAPVLLSGYAAAILCICSLIVLSYASNRCRWYFRSIAPLSGRGCPASPHPIAGDSCSGCCVSNSPNGIVPTEPGPSGGQLTVAPISTEGIFPCSVDGDALPTHHHSSDDAGGGDCISPNGADLDSQSTPGLPVPPRPDPTNPELPSLAPSISHVEFGYQECRWMSWMFG
ncbi:hypothetical protein Nepgr_033847 [Nepenthes gracilis]|uniref:Transmembrane protein n=1 Tax=Nepenthes gracilis TaxID=150966 RepID=A0AAD3TN00_NEPGR|nr:hypothetical protein Nepgr_033847 [Nepenthes gracilis]